MNVKIWPRKEKDKGGYACMPMKQNISVGKSDLILAEEKEDKIYAAVMMILAMITWR